MHAPFNPYRRNYRSLSMRDLLEAREAYHVHLTNIENVIGVHLHRAAAGLRGPLVFAIGFPPGGGRIDGIVGKGTITAANLLGPLAGKPLSDLIADITRFSCIDQLGIDAVGFTTKARRVVQPIDFYQN